MQKSLREGKMVTSAGIQKKDKATNAPASAAPLINIANVLTVLRLVLVPFFIWALLVASVERRWVAFALFAVASLTDKLDGQLARKYNLITDFGKIADGIADKALILSALVIVSYHGWLSWVLTICFLVRELGITLMRILVVKQQVIAAGMAGKLKMVLQVVFLALMMVPWESFIAVKISVYIYHFAFALAVLALFLAIYSAVEYIKQACVKTA